MKATSQPPREFQIAELTRGVQLPLPALQKRHMKAFAESLVLAWEGLLTEHGSTLCSKEEKEINALFEARLNHCIKSPEWSMLAAGVSRGKESLSFDGSHLEKRPDLSVHLTRRPFIFPLIIECKVIEKASGKTVGLYCDEGLSRFIDGDYAWYAQECFMLAYVRSGETIETSLVPHLAKKQKITPDPFLTEVLPQPIASSAYDLAHSRHGRRFPKNPGPIVVWHLWLSSPKPRHHDTRSIEC